MDTVGSVKVFWNNLGFMVSRSNLWVFYSQICSHLTDTLCYPSESMDGSCVLEFHSADPVLHCVLLTQYRNHSCNTLTLMHRPIYLVKHHCQQPKTYQSLNSLESIAWSRYFVLVLLHKVGAHAYIYKSNLDVR